MHKFAVRKNKERLADRIWQTGNLQEKGFPQKHKSSKAELYFLPTFHWQMFFPSRIDGSDRRQLVYAGYPIPSLEIFRFSKENKLGQENLTEKEFFRQKRLVYK